MVHIGYKELIKYLEIVEKASDTMSIKLECQFSMTSHTYTSDFQMRGSGNIERDNVRTFVQTFAHAKELDEQIRKFHRQFDAFGQQHTNLERYEIPLEHPPYIGRVRLLPFVKDPFRQLYLVCEDRLKAKDGVRGGYHIKITVEAKGPRERMEQLESRPL
jgi:hypothetical protein